MDRRGRGMPAKRRMGVSIMKNKRSEDEEKICQYFLQGKCLKVKHIKKIINIKFEYKLILNQMFSGK